MRCISITSIVYDLRSNKCGRSNNCNFSNQTNTPSRIDFIIAAVNIKINYAVNCKKSFP